MPTYADLIKTLTPEEQRATLLALAALAEMPTTSWHPGDVPLSLLDIEAQSFSEQSAVVAAIAKGGILEDSTGAWLEILVRNNFKLTPRPAVFAQGRAVLSCAANAGPYDIDVNQLWASDAPGHRFNNIEGGTLPSGGTLPLLWQAEFAGSAYGLVPGTLTYLLTTLAGVTITNPSGWITRPGASAEKEPALKQRCRDRWPDLGSGATAAAYRLWALSTPGALEVRRALVVEANNLGTPQGGHVTVYLAGDSGAVEEPARAAVAAYIQTKRPLCVTVHVASGVNRIISVAGTLHVAPGYGAAAAAQAALNLAALEPDIAIGGTVFLDAIIEVLMAVPGATHCPLTSPMGDIVMTVPELAKFELDLTIV